MMRGAESVYGFWDEALDLSRVRVLASPIARATGRAFVIHDTVYWPGPFPDRPTARDLATLAHELAHCWQHQTGRRQLSRGLVEQSLFTLFGWWCVRLGFEPLYDPYDYGGAPGVAAADHLDRFRLEAQASIIEHHWLAAVGGAPEIRGEALRTADGRPTRYARDLARLCGAIGLPG